MNIETTNVDPKIKACIAIMEAQLKELKPTSRTEFSIREYLANNPTAKITLEESIVKEGAKKAIREHLEKNPTKEENSGDGR